jgi:formylglycine-generating enzyme required for sulfatase activity
MIQQINKIILTLMTLFGAFSCDVVFAVNNCNAVFLKKSNSISSQNLENGNVEIGNLDSFGKAMTQGLLLKSDQADLFEIYRKVFFGDPKITIPQNLNSVLQIIQSHPELKKPHFQEYEITTEIKVYEVPESVSKYVHSQIQTAGQIRSNLYQIEANLGYWKKLLNFKDAPMNTNSLNGTSKKEALKRENDLFKQELNHLISTHNQSLLADLRNENEDYQKKAKALFKTLQHFESQLEHQGRETQNIRQAMVDLVHTVGFGNQATVALLKSKNGLDKIEGLVKILDERDAVAMDLGYTGHFEELQNSLNVDYPTGFSKNENLTDTLKKLEQDVLKKYSRSESSDVLRVRSLSIQEAPFRSCLGGSDCSSRTYFDKALDPNYNYFTLTDARHHSSGHVTVVLGEAYDFENKETVKIALVDKIQNVPNRQIPIFLKAVSLSLEEKGYLLGLPEDIGDHNGLSNMDTIRHFVAEDILPKLTQKLSQFHQHPSQYPFKNVFSRADHKLNLKVFDLEFPKSDFKLNRGQSYESKQAPDHLDKNKFIEEFLNLKNSQDPSELMRFISSTQFVVQLEKSGLYTIPEFNHELQKIMDNHDFDLNLRKNSFYESLFIRDVPNKVSTQLDHFNEEELKQMSAEMLQWKQTNDHKKRKFIESLDSFKREALEFGSIEDLELLEKLKFIDIHQRDESGFSVLSRIIFNNNPQVLNWILTKPKINFKSTNNFGLTDLEIAKRLGRTDMLNLILKKHPELEIETTPIPERNTLHTTETYPEGTPYFGFVEIPKGSFEMRDENRHLFKVTLTQPFHLMSTATTQKMWREVLELNPKPAAPVSKSKSKYKKPLKEIDTPINIIETPQVRLRPSYSSGNFNPVEQVSYFDILDWLKVLNSLSKNKDNQIQRKLSKLFPGHQEGDVYSLPTEAQRNFAARLSGLARGANSHGVNNEELRDYAWFYANSNQAVHPVGLKKPILLYGQPLYDLQGNIEEWVADDFIPLAGGVDPKGHSNGRTKTVIGGSYYNSYSILSNDTRSGDNPSGSEEVRGFRLVRTHE